MSICEFVMKFVRELQTEVFHFITKKASDRVRGFLIKITDYEPQMFPGIAVPRQLDSMKKRAE